MRCGNSSFIFILVVLCLHWKSVVLKILFIYFYTEGKGGRKRGSETLRWERHIYQLPLACARPGMCPQPGLVPQLRTGIPHVAGWRPANQLSHTSQAKPVVVFSIFTGKSHLKLGINYINEAWREGRCGPIDSRLVPVEMWHHGLALESHRSGLVCTKSHYLSAAWPSVGFLTSLSLHFLFCKMRDNVYFLR